MHNSSLNPWPELMIKHGLKLNFAHQTFKWSNEARGKAAVHKQFRKRAGSNPQIGGHPFTVRRNQAAKI
jgi:hypothetical protein